ncbi:MAG: hypothetical protein HKP27_14620 [Myxococcales bacterium]|nr:hypothetical protein [Myxococcales bacterium]
MKQRMKLERFAVWIALGVAIATPGGANDGAPFDPADSKSWEVPLADLFDVDMEGSRAYAAGYWGMVLRSLDRGATWNVTQTPVERNLHAIDFADEMHGWAVGAQGVIIRTTDGGDSWVLQIAEVDDEFEGRITIEESLFGVVALSKDVAWAVGDLGVIIHTSDGGTTWQRERVPEENFADTELPDRIFNAIEFSTPESGWITGEFGTLLRSADGGASWQGARQLEGSVEDIYLIGMANAGEQLSFACGVGGVAIRTRDGGKSWSTLSVPTGAGLYDIAASGENVIVVGDRGVIFTSADAGETWRDPKRPQLFNWLQGVDYGENGRVVVVGEKATILFSTDGGASFEKALVESPKAARERQAIMLLEMGSQEPPPAR